MVTLTSLCYQTGSFILYRSASDARVEKMEGLPAMNNNNPWRRDVLRAQTAFLVAYVAR